MEAASRQEERRVRVLVVDDSALCRDLLASLLARAPGVEVVATAVDGREAVERVRSLAPDVVTMDLRMPVMDGIEATRAIMAEAPTPILVVTGHPFQAGRNMTFEAIRAGAVDLIVKPDLGNMADAEAMVADLARLVRFVAGIEVRSRPLPAAPAAGGLEPRPIAAVAIAASAGGPRAVHEVLRGLPASFPAGILVVQHIAEGFSREFAAWLDRECDLAVRLAQPGDELRPGLVLVAPAEAHLSVGPSGACRLVRGAPVGGYRPSADVLLSSVARCHGARACGVVLSGMGEDGVGGMADLRARGGLTVAQDESTSVVWGMPKAAIQRGVVDAVLPVDRIAPALVAACRSAADTPVQAPPSPPGRTAPSPA